MTVFPRSSLCLQGLLSLSLSVLCLQGYWSYWNEFPLMQRTLNLIYMVMAPAKTLFPNEGIFTVTGGKDSKNLF